MPDLPFKGYGKLLKVDFHDSACDSHLGTNEQVDGLRPARSILGLTAADMTGE